MLTIPLNSLADSLAVGSRSSPKSLLKLVMVYDEGLFKFIHQLHRFACLDDKLSADTHHYFAHSAHLGR